MAMARSPSLQEFGNRAERNHTLPQQDRPVVGHPDDGGSRGPSGGAFPARGPPDLPVPKDPVRLPRELADDFLGGLPGARVPRAVRRRPRDRPAQGLRKGARHGVVGNPEPDGVASPGDGRVHPRLRGEHDRQGAGPEPSHEPGRRPGHVACEPVDNLRAGQEQRDRLPPLAALDREEARKPRLRGRVNPQPVESVRGKDRHPSVLQGGGHLLRQVDEPVDVETHQPRHPAALPALSRSSSSPTGRPTARDITGHLHRRRKKALGSFPTRVSKFPCPLERTRSEPSRRRRKLSEQKGRSVPTARFPFGTSSPYAASPTRSASWSVTSSRTAPPFTPSHTPFPRAASRASRGTSKATSPTLSRRTPIRSAERSRSRKREGRRNAAIPPSSWRDSRSISSCSMITESM